MIDHLKPYPSYKDSGVEWLGKVPEGWEVRRLGSSVQGCINGVWGAEPDGVNDLPCVRVADFDRFRLRVRLKKLTLRAISKSERNNRLLREGDLLLEKSGGGDMQPVGVVILYEYDARAVCSNFIARMPVDEGYNSNFLVYLHSCLYSIRLNVRSIKQTTGIQNLDSSSYLSELVAFPPLPEQTAIVRFLGYMDRRIQRLIRAKQRLIKLLEEQKQAIIHEAVTGRIDVRTGKPYPSYKDSGVEWLGKVPEGWEVRKLKQLTRFLNGFPFKPSDWMTTGVPIIRIQNLNGSEVFNFTDRTDLPEDLLINHGDLMFAWSGNRGTSFGSFEWTREFPGYLNQHIFKLCDYSLPKRYFYYLLRAVTRHVEEQAGGIIGLVHVTKPELGSVLVPLAPIVEAEAIGREIDGKIAGISKVLSRLERENCLLREYRIRLISDVVTGKVDVREAAALLPDEKEAEGVETLSDEFEEQEPLDEEGFEPEGGDEE